MVTSRKDGRRDRQGFGMDTCTLLHCKWVANKDLLRRELCSVLRGSLDGWGVLGRVGTWTCVAESLCGPPEAISTLVIGYTPIQNKKLRKE